MLLQVTQEACTGFVFPHGVLRKIQGWRAGTCTMPYSSTEAAMMAAPFGVKASVVTPVLHSFQGCVSFLLIAVPCTPHLQLEVLPPHAPQS